MESMPEAGTQIDENFGKKNGRTRAGERILGESEKHERKP